MERPNMLSVSFCGTGGQGVILAGVLVGTTVVTKRGMHAVLTQSFGSEARGGRCQAELIISPDPIASPTAARKDMIVAMSQSALDRYMSTLSPGGLLVIDSTMILSPPSGVRTVSAPATDIATRLGNRISANMVMLGVFQRLTGLFTRQELVEVIKDNTSRKFLDVNLAAVDQGVAFVEASGEAQR